MGLRSRSHDEEMLGIFDEDGGLGEDGDTKKGIEPCEDTTFDVYWAEQECLEENTSVDSIQMGTHDGATRLVKRSGLRLRATRPAKKQGVLGEESRESMQASIAREDAVVEAEAVLAVLKRQDRAWLRTTIPDVGVLRKWAEFQKRPFLDIAQREMFLEQYIVSRLSGYIDSDQRLFLDDFNKEGFPASFSEEDIACVRELAALKKTIVEFEPSERSQHVVEKMCRYRVPWWEANNSLIRLWGQLDCGVQVLSDAQLVNDMVDVLGDDHLLKEECATGESTIVSFANSICNNVAFLKGVVLSKYQGHEPVFDAIIEKRDKEE